MDCHGRKNKELRMQNAELILAVNCQLSTVNYKLSTVIGGILWV